MEEREWVAHGGGDVGVMGGEFIVDRGKGACCAICKRRNGSLGSVRDVFLLFRMGSLEKASSSGGGWSVDSRNEGSARCAGSGQYDVRRDDVVDVRMLTSSPYEFLRSLMRSVEAKFREAGLIGGVVSPLEDGKMMVLVQLSQTPET